MAKNPNREQEEEMNDVAIVTGGLRGDTTGLTSLLNRSKKMKATKKVEPEEVAEQRRINEQAVQEAAAETQVSAANEPAEPEAVPTPSAPRPSAEEGVAKLKATSSQSPAATAPVTIRPPQQQGGGGEEAERLELVRWQVKILRKQERAFERVMYALSELTGYKINQASMTRSLGEIIEHIAPMLESMSEQNPAPRRDRPSNKDPEGLKQLDRQCAQHLFKAIRDSAAMLEKPRMSA